MNLNELAREEVGKTGSAFHFCTNEAGDTVAAFGNVEDALAYALMEEGEVAPC